MSLTDDGGEVGLEKNNWVFMNSGPRGVFNVSLLYDHDTFAFVYCFNFDVCFGTVEMKRFV